MWDVKFNRFSYSMCNFLYFSFFLDSTNNMMLDFLCLTYFTQYAHL